MKLTKNMKKGLLAAGAAAVGTTLITSVIVYKTKKNKRDEFLNEVFENESNVEEVEESKIDDNDEQEDNK